MFIIKNTFLLNLLFFFTIAGIAQQNKVADTARKQHIKTLTVILKDADHDGVSDQFDKEPDTPVGCPVDTHGVTLDTDGDGIPDCRDKEKLSRQDCFPADSNGVVSCPELNCCSVAHIEYFGCSMPAFPSFQFKPGKKILKEQETLLDSLAVTMMNFPVCHIIIQGYYTLNSNYSKQLTTARTQNIVNYITTKWEVSKERFSVIIKEGTYINSVNIFSN